jgi:hypothetical protein
MIQTGGLPMVNRNVMNRLLKSTILSALFSFILISMTVFHHFQIQKLLKEILEKVEGGGVSRLKRNGTEGIG